MKIPASYKPGLEMLRRNRVARQHGACVWGMRIDVFQNVFSPRFFKDTEFFAEVVPLLAHGDFLEIGSGTGAVSLTVGLKKEIGRITAIDINPAAVANTYHNWRELHNRKQFDRDINIFRSDLFSAIPRDQRFDTIFWNVPFGPYCTHTPNMLERAIYDPGYRTLKRFLKEAPEHMARDSTLLLGFSSDIGDKELFDRRVREAGFKERYSIRSGKVANALLGQGAEFELYQFRYEGVIK